MQRMVRYLVIFVMRRRRCTLFPYTTLFRSRVAHRDGRRVTRREGERIRDEDTVLRVAEDARHGARSEEHTSELQSPVQLVCRLLLEKKKMRIAVMKPTSPTRGVMNAFLAAA